MDSTPKSNTIYRHMHPRTFYFYMCLFPSIPDATTTKPTVTFPLTISIYWRVSHFLNVLNITHCLKHELDVDIIVRETKIWKFFVGILKHVCCATNLHVLFNNSRLYPGAAYKFFVVLVYIGLSQSHVRDV